MSALNMQGKQQMKEIDKVLEYWGLLEFLQQDDFPEKKRADSGPTWFSDAQSVDLSSDDSSLELACRAKQQMEEHKKNWNAAISLHIFSISRDALLECLAEHLGSRSGMSDKSKIIDKTPSRISAAAVAMDGKGTFAGFWISPILWGVWYSCSKKSIDDIVLEYNKAVERETKKIEERVSNRPLKVKDASWIAEEVVSKLECYKFVKPIVRLWQNDAGLRADSASSCILTIDASDGTPDEGNGASSPYSGSSYYSQDLESVRKAIHVGFAFSGRRKREDDAHHAVVGYLLGGFGGVSDSRLDVLGAEQGKRNERLDFFSNSLSYYNMPLGRWPSKYPLALMQQVAVNMVAGGRWKTSPQGQEVRDAFPANDIMSVNGPPGTGKTTLLKDIIASNIVDKAHILMQLNSPDDAFEEIELSDEHSEGYLEYARKMYRIKSEYDAINDLSIIVCSTNNAAVENISKELPNGKKFFDGLPEGEKDVFIGADAGDSDRCFYKLARSSKKVECDADLYFSHAAKCQFDEEGLKKAVDAENPDLLISARLGKRANVAQFKKSLGKIIQASDTRGSKEHREAFDAAKKRFGDQYEKVQAMMEHRARMVAQTNGLEAGEGSFCEDRDVSRKMSLLDICGKHNARFKSMAKRKREERNYSREVRREPDRMAFASRGGAAAWGVPRDLVDGIDSAKVADRRKAQLFNPAPDPSCCGSFEDANLSKERDILFLYALQLTREFVLASRCVKSNMTNLKAIWGDRDVPIGDRKERRRITYDSADRDRVMPALFQTLSIVTPVISTTFASVQSMFANVKIQRKGKAPFGLLIVDEAGQATPQAAVGALARCRRALVVGDPCQIPPVVTQELDGVRKQMQANLSQGHFLSEDASVQSFADARNPIGTWKNVADGEGRLWVGCPLVVHRRCVSPMFDISNEISYDGAMINETSELSEDDPKQKRFYWQSSQWINVRGKEEGGRNHFVKVQGRRAAEIVLSAFEKQGLSKDVEGTIPSLFVITPFKSVETSFSSYLEAKLKEKFTNLKDRPLLSKALNEFIKENIGTVHKFQGKEADEVVFLLGCDASSSCSGAVKWVSANIVNVAASRAKYRLYVIGDEEAWRENEFVSEMREKIITAWVSHYKKWRQDRKSKDAARELRLARRMLPVGESLPDFSEGDDAERPNAEAKVDYLEPIKKTLGESLDAELTDEVYRRFGFDGKEGFDARFGRHGKCKDSRVSDFLRMGMFLYTVFSLGDEQQGDIDQSFCAINFCSAFELYLKSTCLSVLQEIRPDDKDINKPNPSIGNYKGPIQKASGILASCCKRNEKKLGETAYSNEDWWKGLGTGIGRVGKYRNKVAHAGKSSSPKSSEATKDLIAWLLNPKWICGGSEEVLRLGEKPLMDIDDAFATVRLEIDKGLTEFEGKGEPTNCCDEKEGLPSKGLRISADGAEEKATGCLSITQWLKKWRGEGKLDDRTIKAEDVNRLLRKDGFLEGEPRNYRPGKKAEGYQVEPHHDPRYNTLVYGADAAGYILNVIKRHP